MSQPYDRVYLNGQFIPLSEAKISVLDRGFLFADGIYEVIPAYGGKLFRLPHHIQRLNNSLDSIRMAPVMSEAEWAEILQQLVDQDTASDQSVYVQVTRGGSGERDHRILADATPTIFAMSQPIPHQQSEQIAKGIRVITLEDIRWQWCQIKSIALLGNVLLKQMATDQECGEAILIRNGCATEGSASNLFIVRDGTLITPPKSHDLLPGITRDLVLELAIANNLPCVERVIQTAELLLAEEIWMTSSTREIMPVIELDGNRVGQGQPGPLWQQMTQLYADYKQSLRSGLA